MADGVEGKYSDSREGASTHDTQLSENDLPPRISRRHVSPERMTMAQNDFNAAALAGWIDIAEMALQDGADPDWVDPEDQYTALMRASENGYPDLVKLLIRYGVNVNKDTVWNPLDLAFSSGNWKIAEALLQAGSNPDWVNPDDRYTTTLMYAVERGEFNNVSLLCKYGSDVNKGNGWSSPLQLAIQNQHPDIVDQLILHGADVHHLLHMCIGLNRYTVSMKSVDMIKALLQAGSAVDQLDPTGRTPLMTASQMCCPQIVSLILKCKPDVNFTTSSGESALYISMSIHALIKTIARMLLLHDASVRPQYYPVMCDGKQITYEIPDHFKHDLGITDDSGILYASGAKSFKFSHTNQVVTNDLQSTCREVIREQLLSPVGGNHNNLLTAVPQLPLPGKLKKYIVYYDHILGSATSTSKSAAEFLAKAVAREACEIIHAAIRRPPKVYQSLP